MLQQVLRECLELIDQQQSGNNTLSNASHIHLDEINGKLLIKGLMRLTISM